MKKLNKFLPKEKPRLNFQVMIDEELFEKVQAKKRKQKLKWQELVEAMFKSYLEEN